ncbi:MAG: serine O-acetyltransferase, partial [Spirochaetia bacterium]
MTRLSGDAHTTLNMGSHADTIVSSILESYERLGAINHLDGPNLPSRDGVESIIRDLESIVFPGFRETGAHRWEDLQFAVAASVNRVFVNLIHEIQRSICFRRRSSGESSCDSLSEREELDTARQEAETVTSELLEKMPEIRSRVRLDVEAAFQGDPASKSLEEVILAYPGVEAILFHRI